MTHPSKRRGDKAELEVQGLLREHLGVQARRQLGAGRKDDIGDIAGLPMTVVQVANRKDVATALREKPLEAEQQRHRAGEPFAVTFLRLRGGEYRACMTIEQFASLWREATA